jgi:hypothetical protein
MTSIVHPAHPVPADVEQCMRAIRECEIADVAREHEVAGLLRPTDEERRSMARARAELTHPGVDLEERLGRLRVAREPYLERVRAYDTLVDRARVEHTLFDMHPPAPGPLDSSFWWARTDWNAPRFIGANHADDGLHLSGKITRDDQSLYGFSFGAVAQYELQYPRVPPSPSGRWLSAPRMDIFGGLTVWTASGDIFDGDCWSKCFMMRRQTIFQLGFGQTGPTPVVIGERVEWQTLAEEENANRAFWPHMPGNQPMPPVVFGNIWPGSVWAHLEVRFDCQLEGNSLLWLTPEVLLRFPQWPVTAA